MKQRSKFEAIFFAAALVFFGLQGILSGEVPAFKGKLEPIITIPFKSQLVPWIGLALVLVGIYILIRFFVWKKK